MSDVLEPAGEQPVDRPRSIVRAVASREQTLEPSGALIDPFAAPEQAHRGSAARPMTLGLLWQHKWLALVVFLVFSIPVVAAIWMLYVPTYSAVATILVSPTIRGILDDNDQIPFYRQFLNTQAGAIGSTTVLQRVLEDPEVRETGWYKNPPRFSALRGSGQELERLQADLSVRPRANTSLVDVKMSTRNPKEAALIVNAVVDNYFVDVQDRAQKSNDVVYGVVVREHNELRARIDGLNSSIAKVRGEIGHWTPDQLLAQQRARLDEREAELEDMWRAIKIAQRQREHLQALAPPSSQSTTAPGEGSETSLANASDSELREGEAPAEPPPYVLDREWRVLDRQMQAARHRVEREQHLGDGHPRMIELRKSVEHAQEDLSIREAQLDEVWRTRPQELLAGGEGGSSIAVDLAQLDLHIDRLQYDYDLRVSVLAQERLRVSQTAGTAELLQKDLDERKDAQGRYETLRERKNTMDLDRRAPASIQKLADAYPSSESGNARKRLMLMAMALFGGVMLGLAAAYLRAVTASSVQHADDLGQAVSLPFLGHVPLLRPTQAHGDAVRAEHVRMVRTALLQRLEEGRGKAIQITSAGPGAGKTTLAVMLAESLARCGKKVLLVDADLRNPCVHEQCDITGEPGLLGVLKARVEDREAIVRRDDSGVSILPVGKLGADADGELLANGVLAGCLRRWCTQFDLVLLDSSPILPVADARILSRLVDGTILVVREKHCHRAGVADALAQLGTSGGILLGMVFIGSRLGGAYGGSYYNYRYPAQDAGVALDVREG